MTERTFLLQADLLRCLILVEKLANVVKKSLPNWDCVLSGLARRDPLSLSSGFLLLVA